MISLEKTLVQQVESVHVGRWDRFLFCDPLGFAFSPGAAVGDNGQCISMNILLHRMSRHFWRQGFGICTCTAAGPHSTKPHMDCWWAANSRCNKHQWISWWTGCLSIQKICGIWLCLPIANPYPCLEAAEITNQSKFRKEAPSISQLRSAK